MHVWEALDSDDGTFAIIAFSNGGAVAWEAAVAYPDRCKGVLWVGSVPELSQQRRFGEYDLDCTCQLLACLHTSVCRLTVPRAFAYGERDHYFGGPAIVAQVAAEAKVRSAFYFSMVDYCHFHVKVGLRLVPGRHSDTAITDVLCAFRDLV